MATTPRGYTMPRDDYLKRLRRIEGQIRGLQRMVENDDYCIDILTQVSAATKALQSVAVGLLDEHLRHCVAGAVAAGDEGESDRHDQRGDERHRAARQVLNRRATWWPRRPARDARATAAARSWPPSRR